MRGENFHTVADFTVAAGQSLPFTLTWSRTHDEESQAHTWHKSLAETDQWWSEWASRCTYRGDHRDAVIRSLLTLKAMTYQPTGGVVAAATTSLPEHLGGVRNWDYRHCWVRDAAFTLDALMAAGYFDEARAWRQWLVRAVAGTPSQLQIMYGLRGERRLPEIELGWLSGYEQSAPVRIGNAAYRQHQLDIYGEVMDALYRARRAGLAFDEDSWRMQNSLMESLGTAWREPDEGIWEVRGARRHFVHSKLMAWVAADRAVKSVEEFGVPGDAAAWGELRDTIHREVCELGFDKDRNSFVQSYGSHDPDASLLVMPLVGFLPATDPRMRGTVDLIQRELMQDGLVYRYHTKETVDGLPRGEGAFLLCSFWLVDNLALQGRLDEARELLDHLLSLRNDVGLLPEQFDPQSRRFLGNFPQAFSHVGLIQSVLQLQRSARRAATK
jgi:GH15 family glucan-1,4-alpha-glucosidase